MEGKLTLKLNENSISRVKEYVLQIVGVVSAKLDIMQHTCSDFLKKVHVLMFPCCRRASWQHGALCHRGRTSWLGDAPSCGVRQLSRRGVSVLLPDAAFGLLVLVVIIAPNGGASLDGALLTAALVEVSPHAAFEE